MSTQDISSFLADIKKLKEQADAQSQNNSRFAIASEKLGELLNATEELDDGTLTSVDAPDVGQPQVLTDWEADVEVEGGDVKVAPQAKSGFFSKLGGKNKVAEEVDVESTEAAVSDDANEAAMNENASENNVLTSVLTSTVEKTESDVQNDSIVSGASVAAVATAGVAALATIDKLSKRDDTHEVKVENGSDIDLVANEDIIEKNVTIENSVHVDDGLEPQLNIVEQAAAQAKENAGQFENRDYEADHVKVQPSDDDASVKEILTSTSQSANEDRTTEIAATAAATLLAGSGLVNNTVVTEETDVPKLADNEVETAVSANIPIGDIPKDQDVVASEISVATEDNPLSSAVGMAAAAAVGGIAAATLGAQDDSLNAPSSEGGADVVDVIAISNPQPGDDVEKNSILEDVSAVEPEFEFSQELPENALSSSVVESTVLTQVATSLEKESVNSILTKPTPISESIQGQAEHEIDISHINADAEVDVNVEAPSLEEAAAEFVPETPAVAEVATVSPVVEAPSLEEAAAEFVPEAPVVADVAAISPAVETPSLEEAAAEFVPEAPAVADVAAISPAVEAPSLEAAAEFVPEAPAVVDVAAISPAVETPSLEEAAAELVPEAPVVADVAALSPVVEAPSLETVPMAAPMIATPNAPSPMAHIPLVSPKVGESVLVQPNENPAKADSAIFTAQSHSIPTAQQDGVQASDLAINSEKVILSGDDIKYQAENGVKKRGFFARLFLKNKE